MTRWTIVLCALLALPSSAAAQDDENPFDVGTLLAGDGRGMTNDEASRLAIDGAPDLAAAEAAVSAAETSVTAAIVAILPTLSLSARYTRLRPINNGPLVSSPEGSPPLGALVQDVQDPAARGLWSGLVDAQIPFFANQFSFDAVLQIPVSEIFLSLLPALEAAHAGVDAAEAQREVTRQDLDRRAREAFYGYVRARALVALAAQRLLDSQEELRLAERARELGAARESERLRAQAGLAQAEAGVAQAQASIAAAAEALRALTQLPEDEELAIAEDVTRDLPPVGETLVSLTSSARELRAESRALQEATRAQRQAQTAAEGQRWPSLRLGLGAQVANPNQRFVPQREQFDTTWDFSVVVAWSPNRTVVADSQASAAAAEALRLQAELDRFYLGLRAQVAQAWSADRSAAALVAAARANLAAANEAYRARRAELAAGQSRFADVLDAERELTAARVSLVEASVAARVARVRLRYATGGAVPAPEAG